MKTIKLHTAFIKCFFITLIALTLTNCSNKEDLLTDRISITNGITQIKIGEEYQLKYHINSEMPENYIIYWKSSAMDILSVSSNGKIQGRKEGKAEITLTAQSNSNLLYDKLSIDVSLVAVEQISFTTDYVELEEGDFYTPNYEIIPNPVNDLFIKNPYSEERKKVIVNVGRIEGQKNQLLLIKSFEKIMDKFPDYKLIIYGEGSKKEELIKYINERKLNDRVVLAGQVDNIYDKIYDASLFVLSSDYEGMPNALIEAMCLGLPVISTDCPCGGPKMLIKDGVNGFLVPVNDENIMSETISRILADDKLRKELSINASKLKEMVSSNVVNQKWLKFIQTIAKGEK